jgi:hypothetical protein
MHLASVRCLFDLEQNIRLDFLSSQSDLFISHKPAIAGFAMMPRTQPN